MVFVKIGTAQVVVFDSIPKIETFKETVALFEVDRFNKVYVVNPKQDLIKLDAEGKELFRFSNYNNGPISKVDVSNPMQILVYYPDFLLVKILDRTLSEIGSLALQNQEIYNSVSLCRSNNNGLWIFDPISQLLQRVNQLGEPPVLSQNLTMLFEKSFFPIQLIEYQNRLLMVVPNEGIMVFDIFGQFVETINFHSSSPICPYGKKIYSLNMGKLISYDLETGMKEDVLIINEENGIKNFKISSSYLYYLRNDSVQRIRVIE